MEKGVVYAVTGTKKNFFREALLSIWSIRRYNPDLPVIIYSDKSKYEGELPPNVDVRQLAEPTFSFVDKWKAIEESPFLKTLYLDTDTFVCQNIEVIYEYLGQFEMTVCLDQSVYNKGYCSGGAGKKHNVPEFFPVYQGGVIGVNKNEAWSRFYALLKPLILEYGRSNDQAALRIAIYYHPIIRILTLSPEWNMKIDGPVHFQMPPYIFHSRKSKSEFLKLEEIMKKNIGVRRVYVPRIGVLSNPGAMLRRKFNGFFHLNW